MATRAQGAAGPDAGERQYGGYAWYALGILILAYTISFIDRQALTLMPAVTLPGIGVLEPWQSVFIAIGLPGVLIAVAVFFLREPARTGVQAGDRTSIGGLIRDIRGFLAAYMVTILGYSITALLWHGSMAWFPTYFMRVFGWTPGDVGIRYGLTLIVAGTAGILTGGPIATTMRQKGRADANIVIGILALVIAVPFGLLGMLTGSEWVALAGVGMFLFGTCMAWGCAAAAVQEITPNQLRGQLSAIYLCCINFFGMGFGATLIAFFTDSVFRNDQAVGLSIATVIVITAPLSVLVLLLARKPYREALGRIDF